MVELEMADGARLRLPLPRGRDPVLLLYQLVVANPDCEQARVIKRAVAITEPVGQCLIESAQALLNSPEDEPADFSACFIPPLPSNEEAKTEPEAKVIEMPKGTQ